MPATLKTRWLTTQGQIDPARQAEDKVVNILIRDGKLEVVTEDKISRDEAEQVVNAGEGFIVGAQHERSLDDHGERTPGEVHLAVDGHEHEWRRVDELHSARLTSRCR